MFDYKPHYLGADGQPVATRSHFWDGYVSYQPHYLILPAVKAVRADKAIKAVKADNKRSLIGQSQSHTK